jgi:hypothetical protein
MALHKDTIFPEPHIYNVRTSPIAITKIIYIFATYYNYYCIQTNTLVHFTKRITKFQ